MYDLCLVIGRRELGEFARACRRIVRVEFGSETRITDIDRVEVAPIDIEKDLDSVLYIVSEIAPETVSEETTVAILPEKGNDLAWMLAGAIARGSRAGVEVIE